MITPHQEYPDLAKALETKSLFFKREDLHPYGSHKGRSLPIMIDTYIKEGIKHFVLSSSGNAALASAHHIRKLNTENSNGIDGGIKIDILVGQHITTQKLRKLEQFKSDLINITSHDRPLQTLFSIAKDPDIRALRQSTDDLALVGYTSLAQELLEIPDLKAVFIGTSSGTTAQALSQYFKSQNKEIEMHIVQTSSCHPIYTEIIDNQALDEKSIADAIVDQTALRKDVLAGLIEDSGGSAWIASNEQIKMAQEMSQKYTNTTLSTNSALSVAGLMQAVYTGKEWKGSVVCIVCGD